MTPLPGGEVGPDETGPGLTTSWLAPEAGWRRGTQLEDHGTDSSLVPVDTGLPHCGRTITYHNKDGMSKSFSSFPPQKPRSCPSVSKASFLRRDHLPSLCLNPCRDRELITVFGFFLVQFHKTSRYPASPWVDHHLSPKPVDPVVPTPLLRWGRSLGFEVQLLPLHCCVSRARTLSLIEPEMPHLDVMVLALIAIV